ncbi:MAG TPA: peptidoglycan recognition family protein [Myxococcota bacterium]|jgi:N-acetyl-anhydromuramyl-L-alanine amidase AmpD|nr:peptidoglycan recognition family protein [Myxococcota bacterium]
MATGFQVCGKVYEIGTKVMLWWEDGGFNAYRRECEDGRGPLPWAPAQGCNVPNRLGPRSGASKSWERWDDDPAGKMSEAQVKERIRQFVIHHDGCPSSLVCFRVLHNQRGLSVHFMLDNDGVLYQSADLADRTRHAGSVNDISVGIEIANVATARGDKRNYYPAHAGRPIKVGNINGGEFIAWGYNDAQYKALAALTAGLTSYFPRLPLVYPAYSDGSIIPMIISDSYKYSGLIAHWHLTVKKWDPGPAFEWDRIMTVVKAKAGGLNYPVDLGDGYGREGEFGSLNKDKMSELAKRLYETNEAGDSGYYPMGVGRSWHGGVHVPVTDEWTPVYSISSGTVVAARMASDAPMGSRAFVLVRYQEEIDKKKQTFWALYMHLQQTLPDDTPPEKQPSWLHTLKPIDKPVVDEEDKASFAEDGFDDEFDMEKGEADKGASAADVGRRGTMERLIAGECVLLNVPVKPGEVLGYVGHYGAEGNLGFHFEIFSKDPLVDFEAHKDEWKLAPADEDTDLIVTADRIPDYIDASGGLAKGLGMPENDGRISAEEMRYFWKSGDAAAKAEMRRLVTRHISEWHTGVDYEVSAKKGELFRWGEEHALADFIEEAKAMCWWGDDARGGTLLAGDLDLPADGLVYHYHPIRFIEWFVETQGGTLAEIAKGSGSAAGEDAEDVVIECDDLPEEDRKALGCDTAGGKKGKVDSSAAPPPKAEGGKITMVPDKARCGESELSILKADEERESGKDED